MSETKSGRVVRPKGRPLRWTDGQAETQATPGAVDRAAAVRLWAQWVPARYRDLLEAGTRA